MNLIGGVGLITLGFALFANKVGEQPFGMIVAIVGIYGFMIAATSGTAHALSGNATKMSTLMLWLNWSLIGVYELVRLRSGKLVG